MHFWQFSSLHYAQKSSSTFQDIPRAQTPALGIWAPQCWKSDTKGKVCRRVVREVRFFLGSVITLPDMELKSWLQISLPLGLSPSSGLACLQNRQMKNPWWRFIKKPVGSGTDNMSGMSEWWMAASIQGLFGYCPNKRKEAAQRGRDLWQSHLEERIPLWY